MSKKRQLIAGLDNKDNVNEVHEVPAGPRQQKQEIEIVQVDKAYIKKRLTDLMNANPDVFNEYNYLISVLNKGN